jgi:IS1 family transposase
MSRIFSPNAESLSLMKRFESGAESSVRAMLEICQGRLGDSWHLDEVFVRINGRQHYLWRAVDQDGDVIDILVQPRRDQRAAERFFRRLLRGQGKRPFRIITDRLRSYSAALRTILGEVAHNTECYATNLAEVLHQGCVANSFMNSLKTVYDSWNPRRYWFPKRTGTHETVPDRLFATHPARELYR